MSVDTKGLLKGEVTPEEVKDLLQQKGYKNIHIERHDERKDDGNYYNFSFITFDGNTNRRRLTISYNSDRTEFNELIKNEVNQIKGDKYTSISLGKDEEAIKIITSIIKQFGGYIDIDDCDDVDYQFIPMNKQFELKPIIHVTMKDIYDKFGGIVIIDDYK